jgi:hypothetical protein
MLAKEINAQMAVKTTAMQLFGFVQRTSDRQSAIPKDF